MQNGATSCEKYLIQPPHRCGSDCSGPSRAARRPRKAALLSGVLLLVFFVVLYGAVPERLPLLIQRLVGLTSALLAMLFVTLSLGRDRPALPAFRHLGKRSSQASSPRSAGSYSRWCWLGGLPGWRRSRAIKKRRRSSALARSGCRESLAAARTRRSPPRDQLPRRRKAVSFVAASTCADRLHASGRRTCDKPGRCGHEIHPTNPTRFGGVALVRIGLRRRPPCRAVGGVREFSNAHFRWQVWPILRRSSRTKWFGLPADGF